MRSAAPDGHDRRRPGDRQEPAGARAARRDRGRAAPTTWREGMVRAYGEGVALVRWRRWCSSSAASRLGRCRDRRGEDRRGLEASVGRRGRLLDAASAGRVLGVSGAGDRAVRRRPSAAGGCSSRRSPTGARPCWCSRTSTGPTRCSRLHRPARRSPRTRRCSWSARPARSCSSSGRPGGGKTNALTLLLQPLADDEVGTLIDHLIDPTLVTPDAREQLLDRTAGNALFAQEYVRALVEAGLTGAAALPDTIQGIIAARLTACRGRRSGSPEHAQVLAGDPELAHARLQRRALQPEARGRAVRAAEHASWSRAARAGSPRVPSLRACRRRRRRRLRRGTRTRGTLQHAPLVRITARSIAFSSSRTLPGQS